MAAAAATAAQEENDGGGDGDGGDGCDHLSGESKIKSPGEKWGKAEPRGTEEEDHDYIIISIDTVSMCA